MARPIDARRRRRRRPRAAGAATRAPARANSGNSSRKSTPRCARLASPGRGAAPPPPTIAAADAEWCGARNGGTRIRPPPGASTPATEWIRVTSSAASSSSGGRIPGSRRASIVLPVPGGPAKQEVVSAGRGDLERAPGALLAAHVGRGRGPACRDEPRRSGSGSGGSHAPLRYATASARWCTGIGSMPASATSGPGLGRADEPVGAASGARPRPRSARRGRAGPGRRAPARRTRRRRRARRAAADATPRGPPARSAGRSPSPPCAARPARG